MKNRYKIRMYESGDGDGGIAAGTIVLSIDRGFSMDAASTDEAERKLGEAVIDGELPGGRVYQICPALGDLESSRAVAFGEHAKAQRVTLEPAMGLYSQFRRLRYVEETRSAQRVALERETVPA